MTGQAMPGDVPGDAGLAARLARLGTCALSDALDVLGVGGVVSGLVPLWEGARLAGPAVTVRLVPGSPEPVPRTARRRVFEESTGVPVSIGGISVRQGDFVVADG